MLARIEHWNTERKRDRNFLLVFEILLRITEGDTWQEAFLKVLPERKNARPIVPERSEEQEEESSNSKSLDIRDTTSVDAEVFDKETDRRQCGNECHGVENVHALDTVNERVCI